MHLSPIMFAGTGSDVGKSVIAAAFCRIFRQDGYQPCPFKAQNMALNSFVTAQGLEIGRAQAMQAEAACIACLADMNPILIKPSGELDAQVILNGRPVGNRSAFEYFRKEGRETWREATHQAFDRLNASYNPIVMEGAGSIAEINLRELDIVNMPMAEYARAAVILIADIDRGGVFASLYGSIMLLPENQRRMIKGIIINKFRGESRLFEKGRQMIEDICHVPVLAVLPYFKDIVLDEEDSVSLRQKQYQAAATGINVAIVMLAHISNFTDFTALENNPRIHLYYAVTPSDLEKAQIVILPGTKNTIGDLIQLRNSGMGAAILRARKDGKRIIGICGGFQIMGEMILDPENIEGLTAQMPGLGLLPVTTVMNNDKHTQQSQFRILDSEYICKGYEIHNGESSITDSSVRHFATKISGEHDGCLVDCNCFGSYMHGIFDNAAFTDMILGDLTNDKSDTAADYEQFKEKQYDKLASLVREHTNMQLLYDILK